MGPARQALPRRPGRACSPPRSATGAPSWPRRGPSRPSTLAYFPLWTYAHPRAIELAERLAGYAPGDLNRVFFTSGGSEAVESAWKLARQYFRMTGQPQRTKVISRDIAYHGTTMGALSITGIPDLKTPFEPLVPGAIKVPNTNFYRAPALRRRRGGLRAVGRRRDRAGHRPRGREHRGRGLPRAGAERRRLLPAAARVLRAGARDLRPPRRAAGLRRGDLRLRPPGRLVRRRSLRLPARHHHRGQGAHLGLRAAGGHDRHATGWWSPSCGRAHRSCTASPSPATRSAAPWPWPTSTCSRARTSSGTCGRPRGLPGRARERSTTSRSSATSAATASSTASSWSRTRRRGSRSTTRSPSGSCGATCPARCSRPGSSAGPTTAATPSCSSPRRSSAARRRSTSWPPTLREVLTEAWHRV